MLARHRKHKSARRALLPPHLASDAALPRRIFAPTQLRRRALPGAAAFHAAWPGALHGCDAHGHVVWCERLRDVRLDALAALPDAALAAHRAQTLEVLAPLRAAAAHAAGRAPLYAQHVYVLDVGGVSLPWLLSHAVRRLMRAVAAVSAAHYGETLHRTYLVNAHPAARAAWGALSRFLPPATVAKCRLVGGAADLRAAALRDGVPPEALPLELGGTHPGVPIAELIAASIRDAEAAEAEAEAAAAEAAAAEAEAALMPPGTPPQQGEGELASRPLRRRRPRGWPFSPA
jgi:hypothetical protein